MYATNYIKNWDDVVQHMLACYPEEGCGIVDQENIFHPYPNLAEDKESYFAIAQQAMIDHDVKCIIHSHPTNPDEKMKLDPRMPSKQDMEGQVASGVEWAIVTTEGENVTIPFFWGDYTHRPPLMQREFIHNIQDCLSFMSDWQYKEYGLELPQHPRDHDWIDKGESHFDDQWASWGFQDVTGEPEARGDVYLYKIRSEVSCHVSVVVEPNLIVHHLPGTGRTPNTEASEIWNKYAVRRIRHKTNPAMTTQGEKHGT